MSRSAIGFDAGELAAGRPYAERADREPPLHDRVAEYLSTRLIEPARGWLRDPTQALQGIIKQVEWHECLLQSATDEELALQARSMRARLRRDGFVPQLVGQCFALVRVAASRTIGQQHYDVQLMAGWALLQGKLVEMETGEGKTIAATLPATTVALAGYPVHVITVNDYLARRDADEMGPLYRLLGLSVGTVI